MNVERLLHRPSSRRLSRRKRILFTVLTAIFVVMFVETSLQIFYRMSVGRWLWEWWAIPIFEADPVRVYRVKANLDYTHKTSEFTARYFTDELGMRTQKGKQSPTIAKPDNVFRILSFGPSFAFGWGVNYEDAYMFQIAGALRVPGKRVELINLGTPSQPPCYQLKWLKEIGHRYQPDLIVQTVYGGFQELDADDTLPASLPSVRSGCLYPSDKMTLSMWARRMRTYSAILFYGWHFYNALHSSSSSTGDGREFYTKANSGPVATDDDVRRYGRYIDFVHAAATNKPDVVFLFIPLSHVIRPADVTRVTHSGRGPNPFDAREKARQMTSLLQSNHWHVINPTDVLVQKDKATRMYNLYDIHFTPAGNKAVADYALPIIQDVIGSHSSADR